MTYKKASEVDSWLLKPEKNKKIILFYGPNYGLVSERSKNFIHSQGFDSEDSLNLVKINAHETKKSIREAAYTDSIFYQKRLIWIKNANTQKEIYEDIRTLESSFSFDDLIIVIESGDIKKNVPLRLLIEKSEKSIALPCYADTAYDIDCLLDKECKKENITISKEAKSWIKQNLSTDRLINRNEIEKLKLFAYTTKSICLEDAIAVFSDTAQIMIEHAIDSILSQDLIKINHTYQNFIKGGGNPFALITATLRQFQTLFLMRIEWEEEKKTITEIIQKAHPPIFFTRKKTIEKAVYNWSSYKIQETLKILQKTVLETRKKPRLIETLALHAFFTIALQKNKAKN